MAGMLHSVRHVTILVIIELTVSQRETEGIRQVDILFQIFQAIHLIISELVLLCM